MTPAPAFIALTWAGSIVASYFLGKYKGHAVAGIILTVILGPLGLLILALPATDPRGEDRRRAVGPGVAHVERNIGLAAQAGDCPT